MKLNELAKEMAERIAAMEPGSIETIAHIALAVPGADALNLDDSLFELEDEVVSLLDERGIVLDRSAYWGMNVGLPYNIPFEVRPIVNGKRGPIEIDEVERLLFSASAFFTGQAEMLLERDDSGALVKTIQGFFTPDPEEAFDVPMSEGETRVLQEALRECDVESWYQEYPNELPEVVVLDGDSWEMLLCLSDGTCIESYGMNAYPECFDDFAYALKEIGFPDFWS